jgi:hypothetical protein
MVPINNIAIKVKINISRITLKQNLFKNKLSLKVLAIKRKLLIKKINHQLLDYKKLTKHLIIFTKMLQKC